MRRIALVLAALMLAFTVSSCGKEQTQTNTADSFSCPTDNTKAFATTRFVADVGLAFGTFHHWIYKPWRAGKLDKAADGHTFARVKAGGAALVTYHLISNAADNVKSSSKLCPVLGERVAQLSDMLSNLKSKILHGDFKSLGAIAGSVTSLSSLMSQNGNPVTETYNQ